MIIMNRSTNFDVMQGCNDAIQTAPNVWAHSRAMKWMHSLNAYDREVGFKMLHAGYASYEWIATWPQAVAAAINRFHPEVFNDTTGAAMKRFLQTDAGVYYKVPGAKI